MQKGLEVEYEVNTTLLLRAGQGYLHRTLFVSKEAAKNVEMLFIIFLFK
jgi:hypothetical protein